MDLDSTKDIAAICAPLTSTMIEIFIKPKLAQLFRHNKKDSALIQHALSNSFEEYLNRSFLRHSYITTVVFQNQKKLLNDLYLPLKVKSKKDKNPILIDRYKADFIPAFQKVLLTDTAGMGKSTIMKFLFLGCVNENSGVPIFIELRKLTTDKPLIDFIHAELNPIDEDLDKDLILKLIRRGDFVFFLDGFDEIAIQNKEAVTIRLQDFIAKATNNQFILTSRPEKSLASFPDFEQFVIEPLTQEEAYELIRKYDQGGELAEQIIQKLKAKNTTNLKEFLTNPLLVSLLYKSYDYKPTIPLRKPAFYRQVYDSLFECHDLTKGGAYIREKASGLDIDNFHLVLRVLGFITLKLGKVEYDKDELLDLIATARKSLPGLSFKDADFLDDLRIAVPLFVIDGEFYRWSHKSIQEYFAAQFICQDAKGKQDNILRRMYQSENCARYINVLDLCYDIDFKSFRRTILYLLACDFREYCKNSYVRIDTKQISPNDISQRRQLCFGRVYMLIPGSQIKHEGNIVQLFNSEYFAKLTKNLPFDKVLMTWDEGGVLMQARKTSFLLTRLLAEKRDSLTVRTHPEARRRLERSASSPFIRPSDVFSGSEAIEITDNPNSPLNDPTVFALVNTLLANIEPISIDPKRAEELIQEVDKELSSEQDNDFFTKGL